MKKRCLVRNNNNKCILFFSGWGMDESAINSLDTEGYDLFHFSDYSEFYALKSSDFNYDEIYLLAWSLGVVAAEIVLEKSDVKITKAIAINGTSYGMHDDYGISESVFKGTLDNWDEKNRNKFNFRMFGSRQLFALASSYLSDRDVNSQKEELCFLLKEINNRKIIRSIWDFAIIGKSDLIMPTKSQIAFWEGKIAFCEEDIPHFPFNKYNSWSEIIDKLPKDE